MSQFIFCVFLEVFFLFVNLGYRGIWEVGHEGIEPSTCRLRVSKIDFLRRSLVSSYFPNGCIINLFKTRTYVYLFI
jgi:hypothetical protein